MSLGHEYICTSLQPDEKWRSAKIRFLGVFVIKNVKNEKHAGFISWTGNACMGQHQSGHQNQSQATGNGTRLSSVPVNRSQSGDERSL